MLTYDLQEILETPPFSVAQDRKAELCGGILQELTRHHYANCAQYRRIIDALGFDPSGASAVEDIPFLPVHMFKEYELASVERSEIRRTITSSGTTGSGVSRILLDAATASNQRKALSRIVSSVTGNKRLPMLIIDSHSVVRDRKLFSARGAGIVGFSLLGQGVRYALDEGMQLDWEAVEAFCDEHGDEATLVFGFTSMIWEHFYKLLARRGRRLRLKNAILMHGGGWKKLSDQAVDSGTFKRSLEEVCGITKIHNYYGMAEQTGSIFIECEAGYLHSSVFSDVIVRRNDFSVCAMHEPGLVQLLSVLPVSYPGHVILSEDMGEIFGEDDCSCGRLGRYFKIYGRAENAEVRGCSDTYA